MSKIIITIILSALLWSNEFISGEFIGLFTNQKYIIELNNGDVFSGQILDQNEDVIIIKTSYGKLEIKKDEIITINIDDPNSFLIEDNIEVDTYSKHSFTQEARWRTIYLGMLQANTLYGAGIPYLFDFQETSVGSGFQLLTFGGSFYAFYKYTEGMDIPYGRSEFQYAGSVLGSASLFPIQAIVGIDNWYNFDENGKIALLYQMIAVPYGLVLSDRLYHKWKLTNGQATVVAAAPALGVYNTALSLSIIYSEGFEDENILRLYIPLIYGGALAHGYLAKNYVKNKSYSRNDGAFLQLSGGIGLLNSICLLGIIESDNEYINKLLFLSGVNAFTYLGDRINQPFDLKKGQTGIIALGTFASLMLWAGTASIIELDEPKIWFGGNMASMTLGWYFTHKKVSSSSKYSSNSKFNNLINKVSINPTFQMQNKKITPAIQLQVNF